ncbi:unnamed protein product [Cylindrotheca closterium]|uniref:Leucine-rich repeat-containing N-terminal plant-type domain-containing protein n=1 Tax=Cylindrotheca closterium TaxID=2856 RepID=A0AAD2JIH6_9STRA|nr:unnamed protein product [Cylindrotheca closterium]
MANPYGHIRYFQQSTTEDDESDGISSLDNAHLPVINSAPSNDEESVDSGILRIKSRVRELETVFSSNFNGKSDAPATQDEEQRSETSHESADVGTLRKELEDADRVHSLSLADYLKVLEVKPAGFGSSYSAGRPQTPDPENLTWNDLMKATASRSGSLADNHSGPTKTREPQDDHQPLPKRRKRAFWIALLLLLVIGIVVAVVVSTDDSVPAGAVQTEMSVTGVSDKEEGTGNDSSDFAPDPSLPVPPSSAATPKPSESKGSVAIQPSSPSKTPTIPTTKEPSNLTKAPIIPTQQPLSPTLRPVVLIPPAPAPSASPVSPELRDQVIGFLEQEYGVAFQEAYNIVAVDWVLAGGVGVLNHKLAQRFTMKVLDLSLRGDNTVQPAGTLNAAKWSASNFDECQWNGVKCNAEGLVTELRLGGRSYGGTIPREIRILQRSLEFLDISKNELVGTLNEDFFQLTQLKRVYLYQNKISGGISPSFALLQNLTHLHMSQCQLSGPLPNDLRRMTNLRYLNLHRNRISGRLPHYMKYMSSLWYLDLGRNDISEDLPNGWGDGMVSLRHLYLDHNRIDKYIPSSYNKLGDYQLQVLVLNNNDLTGSVPLKNPGLVTLNVHNNRLSANLGGDVCAMSIFGSGKLVDFNADCNICHCEGWMCDNCTQ